MSATTGTGGSTAAGAGRRLEILEVSERLFADNGYQTTSMDDIAEAIGITKPAIYHYFRSKDDILQEIHQSIVDGARERVAGVLDAEGRPADKLRDVLVAHTTTVLTRRQANKIFHEEQGALTVDRERALRRAERRYEKVVRALYEEAMAAGELRDADAGIAVATLLGACNWSYRWYRPRGRLTAPELAEVIVDLLLQGHLAHR